MGCEGIRVARRGFVSFVNSETALADEAVSKGLAMGSGGFLGRGGRGLALNQKK